MAHLRQVGDDMLTKAVLFDKESPFGNKDIECVLIAYRKEGASGQRRDPVKQRATKPDSLNEYIDKNARGTNFYTWAVCFQLQGPDARHLPANIILDPKEIWGMYQTLKASKIKMRKLLNSEFEGEYSKEIKNKDLCRDQEFFVRSKEGEVLLEFWLISPGKYKYCRCFNFDETSKLMESIFCLFNEGPLLTKQLIAIK